MGVFWDKYCKMDVDNEYEKSDEREEPTVEEAVTVVDQSFAYLNDYYEDPHSCCSG